jgi:ABC-type transport system involved in multi-copper enzyme maturation permease subunit
MNPSSIAAVFLFEWRRAFTVARMTWWVILAAFPPLIIGMIRFALRNERIPSEPWIIMMFALVPMLVSMLGTFLWATPVVSAELERKSWVYLAVRPHGKVNVLIGKYLVALTWALSAAITGLYTAVAIMPYDGAGDIGKTIVGITLLSCPAYAAVYLLLGTLFPKRSMVIAVAYTLIFELIISFIPAIINTFTVQYRIRTLLFLWSDMQDEAAEMNTLFAFIGDPPAWEHVVMLLAYTLTLLVLAIGVVRGREFSTADEGEA